METAAAILVKALLDNSPELRQQLGIEMEKQSLEAVKRIMPLYTAMLAELAKGRG